jgi:hypothetical protein
MSRRAPIRSASQRVVALLTDFGDAGHHAGVLRGVVLDTNPRARPVDLCHGIPAGDIHLGAWTLRWSWRWFPAGTVHLAVVDPDVGTGRRALAAAAGGQFFVGPDNGLLSFALKDARDTLVVALATPAEAGLLSSTFNGRDLFAPAAARLSRGVPLEALGTRVDDWVRLAEPAVRRPGPGRLVGEVLAVDHWGNLVTSLTAADLAREGIPAEAGVRLGRRVMRGIRRTYADVRRRGAVALINSNGHLEIAVNGGRADALPGGVRGAPVFVTR